MSTPTGWLTDFGLGCASWVNRSHGFSLYTCSSGSQFSLHNSWDGEHMLERGLKVLGR